MIKLTPSNGDIYSRYWKGIIHSIKIYIASKET